VENESIKTINNSRIIETKKHIIDFAENKNITKKKIIKFSILSIVVIALVIIITNISSFFIPTSLAKKYIKAYMTGNYKTVNRCNLVDNKSIIKDIAKDGDITVIEFLDDFDCDSINELISSKAEDFVDEWEDSYGEYSIKIRLCS